MKIVRLIVVLLVVMASLSIATARGNTSSPRVYPDLLADEQFDDDEYDEAIDITIRDPLEPMNRLFFNFNDKLYEWALRPIKDGYTWLLPKELRVSFGNFFYNVAMPVRLVSTFLQADFEGSGIVLQRFVINSTLGVYGLVDVAYLEFDLEPSRADFGQTLGKWGLGEGIYFCWPLFGPSSVRDSLGLLVDVYIHPIPYFHDNMVLDLAYYTTNKVNSLSLKPDLYEDLKRFSLDPYIASRQAYYEYRRAFVGEKWWSEQLIPEL